jgi:hypothetical protein
MACCRPEAPTENPLPPPSKTSQEFSPLLCVAVTTATPFDLASPFGSQHELSCPDVGHSSGHSLLAMSIRLNV